MAWQVKQARKAHGSGRGLEKSKLHQDLKSVRRYLRLADNKAKQEKVERGVWQRSAREQS